MNRLIGVVHLSALPGAPRDAGSLDGVTTNPVDPSRAAAFVKAGQ